MSDENENNPPDGLSREQVIKQLNQVVCICKGIKLAAVLRGLKNSKTVEDVNRKTGCGNGRCKGQRCGPRIKILLQKMQASNEK